MKLPATLLLALIAAIAPAMAQVPTPQSVLGHKPGDDFYLATYGESLGYFQKLAQSTDKLKLVNVGKTTQGRDWYIAIISSPQNLANLDKHIETARRLALVKGVTDAQAHELAHNGKVIVHIDGGLHSTEVAGHQHTIQLAYDLVTGAAPGAATILDNVILVLWFSINPDGQDFVANWYRQNLGTPYEVSGLPALYGEYIGHDNNRDGYMNNMIESRVVTKALLNYYPVVLYDHHQTAPFPTRIFIPPFADPVSLNPHPLMYRWINLFGTAMAAYLDEHDMPGATHKGRFDDWYPGFIDHVNNFRNTISFLTETALYRYGTPHFYTVDEFPADKRDLHAEVYYSSPWKGGWWHLADAVHYMWGASMSVLDTASKNREELIYNRYRAGRDVIERFTKNPPYGYVIPREQRDTPTAATLVEKIMINGIEVHQATRAVRTGTTSYKEGDWVILMDQPFAALVKELFEVQKYPEIPRPPTLAATAAAAAPAAAAGGGRGPAAPAAAGQAPPAQLPYDVTGWTLPMQMGVEVQAVVEPITAETRATLRKLDGVDPVVGKVEGSGPVFAFSHNTNASLRAVNDLLAAGHTVTFSKTEPTIYAKGEAAEILRKNGVDATSLQQAPEGWPVKKPRVGLFEPWGGNMDEGWTRWLLEQNRFPFTLMHNSDVRNGHLREKYDSIVFAEIQARVIMDGQSAGMVPGQYAGGIGQEGADALREFVSKGGTLVVFGNAAQFAIDQFALPVTNVVAGLPGERFFCSGSLLRVEIKEPNHPVVAGLPASLPVMFERNMVFDTKPAFRGKILASYPKDRNPLLSGFLLGEALIQGKVAALDANYGSGHIVLLGFRPQWRGQSHGTYKFFFNALFYGPGMVAPQAEGGGPGGQGSPGGGNAAVAAWKREAETVKGELTKLLDQNRAYFTARGPQAADEGKKLEAALDTFQRDRLPALEDLRAQVEDAAAARGEATYMAQLRKFALDARTKDFSASKVDELLDQYKLAVIP